MRDPVVISDGGKVALSTRTRWNIVYDPAIWSHFSPAKFGETMSRLREEHDWIDVWSLSAQSDPIKINDMWIIRRFDEETATGTLQYVSFIYDCDDYVLEWPYYYRGPHDELVKVTPNMPFYDEEWSYCDTGMMFSVNEVKEIWHHMYRKFTSEQVMGVLSSMAMRFDWQGQIARLLQRLIKDDKLLDAAQVAYCASKRADDVYEAEDMLLFGEVAARLFTLDKLG